MPSAAVLSRAPLLLAGAALGVLTVACEKGPYEAAPLERIDAGPPICAECGDCEEAFVVSDRKHFNSAITYPDYPPAGGPHDPCWAKWGVHDAPVVTERWVHNLEHGGIVFLYNPQDTDDGDLAELALFVTEHGRTLLAPAPELTTQFAELAWGFRLLSSCIDMVAVQEFWDKRFGHSPEEFDDDPPDSCR